MKKLNQNNAIATTAMLTKTNAMKNKMNIFAKVVMLVVMLLPVFVLGQEPWKKVPIQNGTQTENVWCVYFDSYSELGYDRSGFQDGSSGNKYIYLPNENSSVATAVYVKGGTKDVTYYIKVNGNHINGSPIVVSGNSGTTNHTGTIANQSCEVTLNYGWTSSNWKEKSITVSIPLPRHTDVLPGKRSYSFNTPVVIGNTSADDLIIDFAQFFKSFYTSGDITATIKGDDASCFHFGSADGGQSLTIASAGSVYANSSCFTGGSGLCTPASSRIYFTPTAAKNYSVTIRVTYDNNSFDITLTATGAKKTPTFDWTSNKTLAVGTIYPASEIAIVSGYLGQVYLTTSDANKIQVLDNQDNVVTSGRGVKVRAIAAETAQITASIDGNDNWNPGSDSENFTGTNLAIQRIDWTQNLMGFKQGDAQTTLNAVAIDQTSGQHTSDCGAITYQIIGDQSIVSITGNVLTINAVGETSIQATAAQTATHAQATTIRTVKVRRADDTSCDEYALQVNENITTNGAEYSFNGKTPEFLSGYTSWEWMASGDSYIYEVFADNSTHQVYHFSYTGPGYKSGSERFENITINQNAVKLRFNGISDGVFSKYYTNIKVTQKSFLNPTTTTSKDFGRQSIGGTHEETISAADYSNLNSDVTVSLTGDNADQFAFKLDQASSFDSNDKYVTAGCGAFGHINVIVRYQPTTTGNHSCTLHLEGKINTQTVQVNIALTGNGGLSPQTLSWNDMTGLSNLTSLTTKPDNQTHINKIQLLATTDARDGDNNPLPITYTSSDESIAKVVNGCYLEIYKAGEVSITASQPGNEYYMPASNDITKVLTISKVTPNLTITGNTAPDLYTKFPVSASSTGSSDEGYSLASDGKITFSIASNYDGNPTASISDYVEANKTCSVTVNTCRTSPTLVVAHLAATDIYEARTETLTVNAQKVNPIIVWANTSAELSGTQKVGDVVQLNAIIQQNSSYKVTYVSSNTTLATVDNNTGKMTCVAPGIVKITATFTGNVDLIASTADEEISYLFLISPADFGNVQILCNKTIPFLISTGESGTFDISSTDMSGFFIRCSNTDDWVTSLTNVSDGSTVYVKFQPNAATSFDKTSAVTHNSKTYNCNLKGTGTAYTHTFDATVKPVTASSYHPWDWKSLPADFLKNSSSTYTVEIDNSVSGNDAEFLVQANAQTNQNHDRIRSGLSIGEQFRVAFFPTSRKSQFGCTVQVYDSEYPDIKYPITISANGITNDIKTFTADLTHNGEAEEMEISTRYFRPSSGNGNFTITATDHFLLRKNGEASWAKVITGVENDDKFYVYFAPTRNEQGEKVCTLTVRDNTPIYNPQDNEYKVIVKGTPATEQTYTFTENIPVMGLSTESFKHELKNFKPSGDLTIDASNTNYMVSKTENGTYAQTITLTQSDTKEFYIKFAPTEGGEHPAYITVSDVVSTASGTETIEYYVRASGTTSNSDFGSVNIGQASTAMTFSLESLKDRGATSFTITPSNPYVFRAFTDNESSYSSATTQGAIEVTEDNSFNVKFYPETEGETTGNITVKTDNNLTINIEVKGTGVRQSLNFGEVILGNTSATSMQIDLTNMVSSNDYTVTSYKSALFRINEQTEAVTLSGNASFSVRFYPQSATTYNDNNTYFITIRDNSTNKEYKIYCSGIGTGRQQIDFGSVAFSEGSSPVNVSISGYPASGFKLKVDNYQNFWINGQPMQNGADITSTGENVFSISFHPQTTGNVTDKIYVTDGTNKYDVVNVTGNGTKKDVTLNWVDNDKLNVDDVESHLATTGTFDDYITVTYMSDNPSVLYVDNDNPSQAIAMGAGTATLNATIDDTKGQNRYFNFTNSSSFPISKTFTVTEERILVIVPGTNIKRLGNLKENAGSITLDATVQFKDGTAYEAHPTPDYSLTENDGCVTLSGNTLTVVQAGTAKLQMSVSGDPANEIVGNTLTYNIFVTEIGDCSHTELEINNFEFTGQSIKGLEQTLQIQKKNGVLPPMRKLTFHWEVTGRAPQYTFDVKENDKNGNTLMNQISGNYNTWEALEGNKTDKGDVEIILNNNQLENIFFEFHSTFKFGEELSTSKASITDVHVYQKSYFSKAASEPSSLNFGTSEYGKSVQLPLKFDYSAISPLTFEIVSGDDCFSISDSELEDVTDCSDFGQKSVNVVFTPKKVGHCEATIKITAHTIDGDVSFTYDVTGEGIKRKQIINNWSEDVTLPIIFRYENISIGNDPGDTYKPANPQYSVSGKSIVYTSDNEEVLTVDQNGEGGKWLIHVISQGDANITAHIDGDDNTTACDATRKFTVQKGNQTIVWDSWDATNGKTIKTNCNTTDRDILLDAKTQDVAGHDIPTDEIEFTYTIQQTTPCDQTHTTLAEIVKCTDGKQYLRYNGYGAGDVVVSVSAAESKNYYAATNNRLTRTLHINLTPSSEYIIGNTTRNPNDLTYGDLATLSSDVTFNGNPHYNLKEKTEYQYTSSAETVAKVVNTNQLQIQSVGSGSFDLTTNVIQNCYMESKNTSIQLSTSKSSQAIIPKDIPNQATFNQGQSISIDLNNYFYTVDTRHSSGLSDYENIPTYLTKNEKDEVMANTTLTYNVTFTKDDYTCPDFATFDGDHTITINGSAAGEISVTASQAGDGNYNAANDVTKTFRVDRITPTVTVTEPAGTFDYDTDPHTLTASSTGTNYSSANDNDATFTYDVVEGNDVASISGTQLTILKAGTVKVTATQAANCIANSATSEEYTITINRADPQLAWNVEPQDATYDPANNTQSLSVTTNSDADPEFSVTPTDGATIDAQSGVLTITKAGTYTVTATVAETSQYNSASIDKTITISKGIPTLTISGKTPMECYTTQNLTHTTNNDETPSITYTSSDNNIIEVDGTDAVTAKSMGNATITATLSETTSWKSTTTNITIQVTNGTLHFVTEGNWNDQTKWSPVHKLPTSSDNVLIEANCTLNMTAECRDMEIADNGMLTISTSGILNVADTLLNNDESKLRIEADANGQGTLVFHNKKTMPMATVEMWCKGSEGDINPNWQYRGIAVSSATLPSDENAPDLIYQWSETAQTNNEITEQWTKVENSAMSAWNGYAVAKYTAGGADYKTSASGALTNADQKIALAYTADQNSEGVKSGFNLITNSYTAPLNYSQLVYNDGIENGVVLFNTGSYVDWKNPDISDGNAPGQYLFLPKITGEEITSGLIPSGESFFVVAHAAGKSITIPYTAVEQQVNGALRMPERREVYGKLIIEVDGGEGADRLYLLENENRIRGFENGYDGPKYAGTKGNPMLYATTDDGRLSVSADSSLLGQYIGFAAGKHDVTYTISFDASALSGYSELYLYDTREKRYINILDGGTYTFKGLVSGEDKRFKIVGSRSDGESVTGDEQMIIVTGNRFHVSGYDNTDERIYLVDMTGKILWETSTAFGPWFDIPTDIPAGVYVIKTGNHTAKMAVK